MDGKAGYSFVKCSNCESVWSVSPIGDKGKIEAFLFECPLCSCKGVGIPDRKGKMK